MNIRQKQGIFFITHAITILSLFTYSVRDEKVKITYWHSSPYRYIRRARYWEYAMETRLFREMCQDRAPFGDIVRVLGTRQGNPELSSTAKPLSCRICSQPRSLCLASFSLSSLDSTSPTSPILIRFIHFHVRTFFHLVRFWPVASNKSQRGCSSIAFRLLDLRSGFIPMLHSASFLPVSYNST